jgi:DNA-binding NarL/FixJ family response regulator
MDIAVNIVSGQKTYFLGQKNIQNSLMLGHLQQKLGYRVPLYDQMEQLPVDMALDDRVLLLDCQGMRISRCTQLLESLTYQGVTKIALVNAEESGALEQLIIWPALVGIFYKGCSVAQVCKGIHAMARGEYWFSRRLFQHYLQQHRRTPNKSREILGRLTRRERQILRLTATGAKNAEIAVALNVSAHTVKTHMYNLFKKLNVANRIQAINWAKEYLHDLEADLI